MNWGDKRDQLKQQVDEITKRFSATLFQKVGQTRLEPSSVTDWFSGAFQKRGATFYGGLATTMLSAYFLSNVTALLAGRYIPEPPLSRSVRGGVNAVKKASIAEYDAVMARNLFNSKGIIPDEEAIPTPGQPSANEPPVRTTLPFNLIGTLILRDEFKSIATIEDKTASMVYPVRMEDEIPGKARITRVEARRVIFVNISNGRNEFVDIPEDPSAVNPRITLGTRVSGGGGGTQIDQVAPNQYNVARNEIDRAFSNINEVLTQARAVPNFENGVAAGYKLFQIVPNSIYSKLGFQDGDIILGFDGQPANDPAKALEAMNNLRTANHAEIQVKRNGKAQTFTYDIR